jgi:RNA polymerase sigma factor (TIGR02999 family)
MSHVTRILSQIESGDPSAAEKLLPLVYDELRKLAAGKLAQEKPGQTLQATALVHEAYLKLVGTEAPRDFANRRHFFSAAAEAMRQILVDQARRKLTVRHGGQWQRLPELPEVPTDDQSPEQTVLIHQLLDQFAVQNRRPAEVAKLRLFLHMTLREIAEILGVSADTAEADWAYARAWIQREYQAN